MTCDVISTGSQGNAVVLEGKVLLDCGVPYRRLQPFVKELQLVLLTHAHGDHFKARTVRRLHQERPALRFGCMWHMIQAIRDAGVTDSLIDVYEEGQIYEYGAVAVSPFPLVHDVENCGYRVRIDGRHALYATDTASMNGVVARDYDLYMVEANFTQAELEERIRRKIETGEFIYEYQAAARHLSKEMADAWLAENATPGKSRIIYLHEHKEKNHAE